MTSLPIKSLAAALLLHDAWRSGNLLGALPSDLRPQTLSQGYDIQDKVLEHGQGDRCGWKLGVGSSAAMRAGGLSRPLVGQLSRNRCYESGMHLPWQGPLPLTVECEIAFVMGRDLPPLPGRRIEEEDVRATVITFEILRSRFINRKIVGWPSYAADNVGFEALIVGPMACLGCDGKILQELAETTVVSVNGTETSRALKGELATDPLASLLSLYTHAAERGITIRAGEIVSTGALCQPFDLGGAGYTVAARYLDRKLEFSV